MSNHKFVEINKTRRILELTIFFFLAFSLLSFSYSDFVPITKKVIYDINPNITVKPYLVTDFVKNSIKDIRDYEEFKRDRAEKIGKIVFNSVYLKQNNINLNTNEDEEFILNLEEYISNENNLGYILTINNNIQKGYCQIFDKTLKCNFDKDYYGEQNLSLTFTKLFWDDDYLNIKLNVLPVNDEPILKPEFSLPVGKTIIDSSYHEDFNMLELFEDEDSNLSFDYDFDSNGVNVNCNLNDNIFSCDFPDHGYTDIRFKASDEEGFVYSPYYRVALLNQNDLEFIFDDYNKDSFKVVDTQAFDLPLKLKGLDFNVYDLNISIKGLENNQIFDFNLPKDENIEFLFEDLNTTTPGDYNIIPVINGVEVDEINVLSIPNNAESLKDYFEIYPNVLGDYKYVQKNNYFY